MPKMLIIAEKPSVAKDIAAAVGGNTRAPGGWYEGSSLIISNALGHLVELHVPEAEGKFGFGALPVIPPNGFRLKAVEKTRAILTTLGGLMRRDDVTTIVNACDAGREGELIFRYIYYHLGCKKPMKRMWLQTMTKEGIVAGYKGMREGKEFDPLFNAGQSRSEADWLIGINASRAVSELSSRRKGARDKTSAGRVQTPTLAIIVRREDEIKNFKPRDYWEVHGTFGATAGDYDGRWLNAAGQADGEDSRFRTYDRAVAQSIVTKCSGVAPSSVIEETTPLSKASPRLFDLTTLQRQANVRFGFAASKTLSIAQSLYEKYKATTYPRTDAVALPEDYVETAKAVMRSFEGTELGAFAVKALESKWIKPVKRIFDNSKISDHFAIIPTGKQPAGLSPDEAKIYDMVSRRFIAAFYPAAEYQRTIRTTTVVGESFQSSGRVLITAGWLAVYGQDMEDGKDKDEPALMPVRMGESVDTKAIKAKSLATKPPVRFTEATLLAAMEGAGKLIDDDDLREAMKERGLGTPATRASTIEKLLDDGAASKKPKEPFVVRQKKNLVPTAKGMELIHLLEELGLELLASPRLTGEWEHKLHLIEKGKFRRADFMGQVADMTRSIVATIGKQAADLPEISRGSGSSGRALNTPCPRCGAVVFVRPKLFACGGCEFKIWAEIANRPIAEAEAEQLMATGRIPELKGFTSKKSKAKFDAGLKIGEDGTVQFVFKERVR